MGSPPPTVPIEAVTVPLPHSAILVGQRVRVSAASADGMSRRALVLSLDGTTHAEIEYEGGNSSSSEEDVVALHRCAPLLPFELSKEAGPADETPVQKAERLKAQGNALFKLRDAAAALDEYVTGLRCLQADAPLSAGSRCLLKPAGGGPLRSALVLALDGTSCDVAYEGGGAAAREGGGDVSERLRALIRQAEAIDDGSDPIEAPTTAVAASGARDGGRLGSYFSRLSDALGRRLSSAAEAEVEASEAEEEEEEDGVARERVAMVVHGSQPALQVALLLNSAKASLLAREWQTALARALRAEHVAAHDGVEPAKTASLRRTALIVCARAHLGMQRFGKATTFAARLLAAVPSAAHDADAHAQARKEARALLRDIQRRAVEVKRSNKALAKSLSEWVQAAMQESGQSQLVELG